MKKLLSIAILLSLLISSCSFAESKNQTETISESDVNIDSTETTDFGDFSGAYLFTSGVGGWASMLTINDDGSFVGEFHDSEMGSIGADYDGTVYISAFNGSFSNLEKLDDNSYSAEVYSLTTEGVPGEEYIEDGIKYIYSDPYGISQDSEIIFWLSGTDISNIPEEFITWAKNEYYFDGDVLPVTGLMTKVDGEIYGWMLQSQ